MQVVRRIRLAGFEIVWRFLVRWKVGVLSQRRWRLLMLLIQTLNLLFAFLAWLSPLPPLLLVLVVA